MERGFGRGMGVRIRMRILRRRRLRRKRGRVWTVVGLVLVGRRWEDREKEKEERECRLRRIGEGLLRWRID